MLLLLSLQVYPHSIGLGLKDLCYLLPRLHFLSPLKASAPLFFLLLYPSLAYSLYQAMHCYCGNHSGGQLLHRLFRLPEGHVNCQTDHTLGDARGGYLPPFSAQMLIQTKVVVPFLVSIEPAPYSDLP